MINEERDLAMKAFAAAGSGADQKAALELAALKARIEELAGRYAGGGDTGGADGLADMVQEITLGWAMVWQAAREAVGDDRGAVKTWALQLQMRAIEALEAGDVPEGEAP